MMFRGSRAGGRLLVTVWLSMFVLAAAGCGPSTATVTGTVNFQGNPLPSGTVVLHAQGGASGHAMIVDGRYTIEAAPLGPVRITVQAHATRPAGMPGMGKAPAVPAGAAPATEGPRDGKHVRIPPRYQNPETSGLTYTVLSGRQTHDIQLQE